MSPTPGLLRRPPGFWVGVVQFPPQSVADRFDEHVWDRACSRCERGSLVGEGSLARACLLLPHWLPSHVEPCTSIFNLPTTTLGAGHRSSFAAASSACSPSTGSTGILQLPSPILSTLSHQFANRPPFLPSRLSSWPKFLCS
jgi:hypothetical protein